MFTTIIHTDQIDASTREQIEQLFNAPLEARSGYHRVCHSESVARATLLALSEQLTIDINTLPQGFEPSKVGLLVSDMDSTLINIECIDEIADYLNVKPQVSAVTEAAMRGEIDFVTSLTQRVALLEGVDEKALDLVYSDRLQLNPGAEQLISELKSNAIKFCLVSGGFTFFTERLKQRLSLDYAHSNQLGIEQGKLTGKVVGDIVGAQAKADLLIAHCQELNINAKQTIAVGDGANDLLMMKEAGLSVAYHAKPAVQAQAATAINYGGLDSIVHMLSA